MDMREPSAMKTIKGKLALSALILNMIASSSACTTRELTINEIIFEVRFRIKGFDKKLYVVLNCNTNESPIEIIIGGQDASMNQYMFRFYEGAALCSNRYKQPKELAFLNIASNMSGVFTYIPSDTRVTVVAMHFDSGLDGKPIARVPANPDVSFEMKLYEGALVEKDIVVDNSSYPEPRFFAGRFRSKVHRAYCGERSILNLESQAYLKKYALRAENIGKVQIVYLDMEKWANTTIKDVKYYSYPSLRLNSFGNSMICFKKELGGWAPSENYIQNYYPLSQLSGKEPIHGSQEDVPVRLHNIDPGYIPCRFSISSQNIQLPSNICGLRWQEHRQRVYLIADKKIFELSPFRQDIGGAAVY
jgi:hypothetical protein